MASIFLFLSQINVLNVMLNVFLVMARDQEIAFNVAQLLLEIILRMFVTHLVQQQDFIKNLILIARIPVIPAMSVVLVVTKAPPNVLPV